jgi:hypothetical protein
MPWFPELFSAPILERIRSQAADARVAAPVPYFAGVTSGEIKALIESFAGEPELHHPVRGRVKGRRAFEEFVAYTNSWLVEANGIAHPMERIATTLCWVEETVVTFDGDDGRVELPIAIAAQRADDGRITEVRMYYSTWPFTGRHASRAPLLQPDPDLDEPDVVGEYQRALADGDVHSAVAAFEPDGYVREPSGAAYVHRGHDELVALLTRYLANGGLRLERCAVVDDGRACALEYNVVGWGHTDLLPQAGLAVYVRGPSGKLASARIYDDTDPPVEPSGVAVRTRGPARGVTGATRGSHHQP